MADEVAAVNTAQYDSIATMNTVEYSNIAAYNHVSFVTTVPDLSTGLVGYYPFEESAGPCTNLKYVATTYPNFTVLNTPTRQQTGKKNYAYTWNGTNTSADGSDGYRFSDNFTISTWIYDTSLSGSQGIVTRYNSTANAYRSWYLRVTNGNVEIVVYSNATGTNKSSTTTTAPITLNTWHHVVAVKDGSSLTLYVNDSSGNGATPVTDAPNAINQGTTGNVLRTMFAAMSRVTATPDNFFKGRIDEVAMWNRGLTQEQIAYLYNSGTGRFYTTAAGFT